VESGRILVGRAPESVLAALPGFGPEAIARALNLSSESPRDLLAFSALLSPTARTELMAHAGELQSTVTFVPDAWIVMARAEAGSPPVVSEIEVRIVRAGTRAAIVRRRSWP
jgi:hypothetical protein